MIVAADLSQLVSSYFGIVTPLYEVNRHVVLPLYTVR